MNLNFLNALHLQFIDNIWQYDLIGEIKEDQDLPLDSLIYMDIKLNNINQIAGCILISKNSTKVMFSCKVNKDNQALTDKIIIPKEKSNISTLNFEPQLTEDQNILVNKSISFIKAEKLFYNENKNIWEFLIIISNYSIPLGSKSIIDILYNGALSSAICLCDEPSVLNCYVALENQTEYDLVKIQFIKSNYSTIEWENLTYVYEIPIEKELDFISIYDLSFFQKSDLWKYKIKFQNGILPENALVKVDFLIKNNITYDNCYYYNSVLNCETHQIGNSSLILLSYIKKYGSITWRNLNKDLIVPINLTINYIDSYNLRFLGNSWNFYLKLIIYEKLEVNYTIIIKIKYGENKADANAYCYPIEINSDEYNCKVVYKDQKISDNIIITAISDSNLIWENGFEEKTIVIEESITITKIYDLLYNIYKKWEFKINIEQDLPNNSTLILDILYNENNQDTATCLYYNRTLLCTRDSYNQSEYDSLKISSIKINGSITIINKESIDVNIPITLYLNYTKSYGLFFNEIWYFYVDVEKIIKIPNNSFVLLDVLLNNIEVASKCELPLEGEKETLFCYIDKSIKQTRKDTIIINFENIYGSIRWTNNNLTELNNTISEDISEATYLLLVDAYDLDFLNGIWSFKIWGLVERKIEKGELFIIEITYLLLGGEFDTIAKCWTQGGNEIDPILFLCNVEYENQSEEGSIKMKNIQSDIANIIWIGGVDSDFQIALKAELYLVKAYDLIFEDSWKFKIEVGGKLLPPGAKIIVDIDKK